MSSEHTLPTGQQKLVRLVEVAYVFIIISRWDVEGRGVGRRESTETWKDCKLNVYASAQHKCASESPVDRLKSGWASQDWV